jgi:hypothetical protein
MCRPGSVIEDCGLKPLVPTNIELYNLCKLYPKDCGVCRAFIPSSKIYDNNDNSEKGDEDKDERKDECVPIAVYSSICSAHKSSLLPECTPWNEFCQSYNEMILCPPVGPKMPFHRPYLHIEGPEYMLIPGWVTNTYFSSLIALIASFCLGLIYEIQAGTRKRLQAGSSSLLTSSLGARR